MDGLSENDLAAHLRELEQRLHDPTVRGSAFLTGEMLDEDFTEFGSSGKAYGRPDTIAALAAGAGQSGAAHPLGKLSAETSVADRCAAHL